MLASLLLDGHIRATCVRWLSDLVDENGVPSDAIWLVQRVDGVEKGVRHYMRLALSDGLAEAMYRETGIFSAFATDSSLAKIEFLSRGLNRNLAQREARGSMILKTFQGIVTRKWKPTETRNYRSNRIE